MPAESFAKQRELLDKTAIVAGKLHEYLDRNFFWLFCKRFDFLLQCLFQIELLVIGDESLLYVPFLLG